MSEPEPELAPVQPVSPPAYQALVAATGAIVPVKTPVATPVAKRREVIREFLESTRRGDLVAGMSRYLAMIDNMARIARNPKHPQAVAAFNALMDRAHGKARMADEDAEVFGKGGLQVIYVANPSLDQEIPVTEASLSAAPEPNFIDAEFTSSTEEK